VGVKSSIKQARCMSFVVRASNPISSINVRESVAEAVSIEREFFLMGKIRAPSDQGSFGRRRRKLSEPFQSGNGVAIFGDPGRLWHVTHHRRNGPLRQPGWQRGIG